MNYLSRHTQIRQLSCNLSITHTLYMDKGGIGSEDIRLQRSHSVRDQWRCRQNHGYSEGLCFDRSYIDWAGW